MPRFRRLSALVLTLVLASSVAMAAPRPTAEPSRKGPAVSAVRAEVLMARFWGWLTGAWTKAGCGSDPDGTGAPGGTPVPPGDHADIGCGIDPDGTPCAGGS